MLLSYIPTLLALFCFVDAVHGSGPFMRVGIGAYILNVGAIDLAGGSVYLDYLLTIKQYKQPFSTFEEAVKDGLLPDRVCPDTDNENWTDWNGTRNDITVVNLNRLGEIRPQEYSGQFRVLGDHFFRTNLERWPFETQTLELIVEFNEQFQGESFNLVVCHINQYSGLSSSIRFPGEKSLTLTTSHHCVERCWPPFSNPDAVCQSQNYVTPDCDCTPASTITFNFTDHFSCRCQGGKKISSRYFGLISFNRPEGTAFLKIYLPPLFILFVVLVSYFIPAESDDTRFSICSATLLAGVFFHVSIRSELPVTSTLTDADHMMLSLSCVNLLAWLCALVLSMIHHSGIFNREKLLRAHTYVRSIGPPLSFFTFIIVAFNGEGEWWAWFLLIIFIPILCYLQLRLDKKLSDRLDTYFTMGNDGKTSTNANDTPAEDTKTGETNTPC